MVDFRLFPAFENIPYQPRLKKPPGTFDPQAYRILQDSYPNALYFKDGEPFFWTPQGDTFYSSIVPGQRSYGSFGTLPSGSIVAETTLVNDDKGPFTIFSLTKTRTQQALDKIRTALTLVFIPSFDNTGYSEQFVVIENDKKLQPDYTAPIIQFLNPNNFETGSNDAKDDAVHPYGTSLWRYHPPGSNETYNLFLEAYQRRGFYQPNEVSCKQLVDVVNQLPGFFPKDKTLRVLDIAAGSAYEAELMQLAKKGFSITVNINPFRPTQMWTYFLQFDPEKVEDIEFVGHDLEEEAANAAHEIYGIKNWKKVASEYVDDPYLSGYVVGSIRNQYIRTKIKRLFKGDQPNVLYCAGALGLPHHVSMEDFIAAYNLLEPGGLVVANIHDNVLENKYGNNPTGNGFHNFYQLLTFLEEHPENPYFELVKLQQWSYRLLLQEVGTFSPQSQEAELKHAESRGVHFKTAEYFVLRKKQNMRANWFINPVLFEKYFNLPAAKEFDLSDPVVSERPGLKRLSQAIYNMSLMRVAKNIAFEIMTLPPDAHEIIDIRTSAQPDGQPDYQIRDMSASDRFIRSLTG